MEAVAAAEDDSEPAKLGLQAQNQDRGETHQDPVIKEDLEAVFGELRVSEREFVVEVEGREVACAEGLLARECRYFEALAHFHRGSRVVLRGGVSLASLQAIVTFLQGGSLAIHLGNCQELLEAATFLQCRRAEEAAVAFLTAHLARDNAFQLLRLAQGLGCRGLEEVTRAYIAKVFGQVLAEFGGLEALLGAAVAEVEEVLGRDVQVAEDLLLLAVLAWVEEVGREG